MARSVLGSFVSGTRQVLFVQLFISVGAIALAGWTLGITNDLIREREALNTRVIQLEEELARNNIVPPAIVEEASVQPAPVDTPYPPSAPEPSDEAKPQSAEPTAPTGATPPTQEPTREPNAGGNDGVRGTRGETSGERPTVVEQRPFDLATIFARPPALSVLVLHVRNGDVDESVNALRVNLERSTGVRVVIDEMQANDRRETGYAYFDGRQGRAAAVLVQQFNDAARQHQIAPWAVQLRGVALPAQGEYTADRVDIVLPPRPRAPTRNPALDRAISPGVIERAAPTQPQQTQPIR